MKKIKLKYLDKVGGEKFEAELLKLSVNECSLKTSGHVQPPASYIIMAANKFRDPHFF